MEFSLLGAALVGVAAVYGVISWEARRGSAAECTRDVWDTALVASLAGLAIGRLAAMIIAGTNPLARPADVIVVRGGVDTVWASAAALATMAALTRRQVLIMADALGRRRWRASPGGTPDAWSGTGAWGRRATCRGHMPWTAASSPATPSSCTPPASSEWRRSSSWRGAAGFGPDRAFSALPRLRSRRERGWRRSRYGHPSGHRSSRGMRRPRSPAFSWW